MTWKSNSRKLCIRSRDIWEVPGNDASYPGISRKFSLQGTTYPRRSTMLLRQCSEKNTSKWKMVKREVRDRAETWCVSLQTRGSLYHLLASSSTKPYKPQQTGFVHWTPPPPPSEQKDRDNTYMGSSVLVYVHKYKYLQCTHVQIIRVHEYRGENLEAARDPVVILWWTAASCCAPLACLVWQAVNCLGWKVFRLVLR